MVGAIDQSGALDNAGTPSNESEYDYVKTPKEYIALQLSDFFRVPKSKLMPFNLDGTDNIDDLTKALNSTSNQGTELYLKASMRSANSHFGNNENIEEDRFEEGLRGFMHNSSKEARARDTEESDREYIKTRQRREKELAKAKELNLKSTNEGMSEEEWARAKEQDRLEKLPIDQQLKIKQMIAMLKAEKKPKK
jgi:hypothetical protein